MLVNMKQCNHYLQLYVQTGTIQILVHAEGDGAKEENSSQA